MVRGRSLYVYTLKFIKTEKSWLKGAILETIDWMKTIENSIQWYGALTDSKYNDQ